MSLSYNETAGRSIGRLGALSDGVFAFAMTLLVLDLRVPAVEAVHSENDLRLALYALGPSLLAYLLSFMTLGVFWIAQHTQLSLLKRSDRNIAWIQLGFLLAVTMVPFTTKLLAAFITYRTALVIYWLNIVAMGAGRYCSWNYAFKARLIKDEALPEIDVVRRRILSSQAFYAVGAALSVVNTYVGIGFIILVQISYVLPQRLGILRRF